MDDLFLGVFLTSIVGLIIGLIKPTLIMDKGRRFTSLLFFIILIVSFVGFSITLSNETSPFIGLLGFSIVPVIIIIRLLKKANLNKSNSEYSRKQNFNTNSCDYQRDRKVNTHISNDIHNARSAAPKDKSTADSKDFSSDVIPDASISVNVINDNVPVDNKTPLVDTIKEVNRNVNKDIELPRVTSTKNPGVFGSFIALDLETTGLSPINDRILELGAIKYTDGKPVTSFNTLINPNVPISKRITRINGISDEMVSDKPSIENVIDDFISFFEDLPLLAHNASFDIRFLNANLIKIDKSPISNEIIDTLSISRKIFNFENNKLDTIKKELNLSLENAHRAIPDCYAVAEIYFKYLEHLAKKKNTRSNKDVTVTPSANIVPDINVKTTVKSEPELSHEKICEIVKSMLLENNRDINYVRHRESSMYFQICCFYDFVRIKTRGHLIYMVSYEPADKLMKAYPEEKITPTSTSETGESRIFLNNENSLIKYKEVIIKDYDNIVEVVQERLNNGLMKKWEFEKYLSLNKSL